MPKDKDMAQFNVRMDAKLLAAYKEYCREQGLDPHQQVINFIKRVVETKYNFQERLWEHIKGKG